MKSMMAIVSKSIFEKARSSTGSRLGPGDLYVTDRYVSSNKGLEKSLTKDLYLVTVQDDVLWLAGVLRAPAHQEAAWVAAPNTVAVTSLHTIAGQLRFESDTGINLDKLAMSLQTPRVLTGDDVAAIEGVIAAAPTAGASRPSSSTAETVVSVLSQIIKRTEDEIINDKRLYSGFFWADEWCLDDEFEWSDKLPKGGGFMDFEDEYSFFRDEPLYSGNMADPTFAKFMEKRDGALPMPLARQLLTAGIIEPESPSVVGHLVRGSLVEVATALFTRFNDLEFDEEYHEVEKRWRKMISAIPDRELRQKLGCLFQDADTARGYGACFGGTTGGPLEDSCVGKTVASWEFGEGQGALVIVQVLEDPHPPLPASALKAGKPTKKRRATATRASGPTDPMAEVKRALADEATPLDERLGHVEALLTAFDTIPTELQPKTLEMVGHALAGQREPEALALFRRALALGEQQHADGNGVRINVIFRFAETTDQAGNHQEAIDVYTRLMVLMPDFDVLWFNRACGHGIMGNAELAVLDLKRAIEMRSEWRSSAKKDAYFDPVRKHPAFMALMKK